MKPYDSTPNFHDPKPRPIPRQRSAIPFLALMPLCFAAGFLFALMVFS
jgi:hypothetical protein